MATTRRWFTGEFKRETVRLAQQPKVSRRPRNGKLTNSPLFHQDKLDVRSRKNAQWGTFLQVEEGHIQVHDGFNRVIVKIAGTPIKKEADTLQNPFRTLYMLEHLGIVDDIIGARH